VTVKIKCLIKLRPPGCLCPGQ